MKSMLFGAIFGLILCGGVIGCHSSQPTVPAPSQAQVGGVPIPLDSASQPAPPQTAARQSGATESSVAENGGGGGATASQYADTPPVDVDMTAGVRGTQIVKFVVLSEGKRIEGAHITVLNARGKSEGDGKTDDWGEFHVGLAQASYKVSVEWQGKTTMQPISVKPETQSIDLKLE